jgi:hypothetical protein
VAGEVGVRGAEGDVLAALARNVEAQRLAVGGVRTEGMLGSSTNWSGSASMRNPVGSGESADAAAGTSSPRRSSSGTAYEGTTRRGSQTSSARVVSTTGRSPANARIRL